MILNISIGGISGAAEPTEKYFHVQVSQIKRSFTRRIINLKWKFSSKSSGVVSQLLIENWISCSYMKIFLDFWMIKAVFLHTWAIASIFILSKTEGNQTEDQGVK